MSDHPFEESLASAIGVAVKELIAPLRAEIIAIKAANAELRGQVKTLQQSGLRYRGTYEDGERYETGDACTSGGSVWRANEPTTSKPGQDACWKLVVRKGRDGKDAMNGHARSP
jgi:hypothetical protein